MNGGKRCLVIVRAGDASRHPGWIDPSRPRTFDLVVSYYGRDPDRWRGGPFRCLDDVGQKYHGLQAMLRRESFWRDYDWIWLPDDDLATEQDEIDHLFAIAGALRLDLVQPALDWHSHYGLAIVLQSRTMSVRFTDMVEIMAPCFSRAFLERCLSTFDANLSGWGLSYVWPHLLGAGLRRCGILDEVTVTHTRPMGGPSYDRLRAQGSDPRVERISVMRRYGLDSRAPPRSLGAIERTGRFLDLSREGDAARFAEQLQHDVDAFRAERPGIEATSLGRRGPVPLPRSLGIDRLREIARAIPFA
ncbi:hypothetical protein BURK1_03389 [Burkholderiales bacterium]|nr:hypothetical protein BURK1_03389 [Burkholderiales bacterium]